MKITLSPSELSIAHTLAVMRNAANRGNGITDRQMGKQDPIEIERDGVAAEIAFAKAFNLFPDLTIQPRKGGADVIGRTGSKIDIKATRIPNGRLLVTPKKAGEETDVYVLAIIDGATVDLVGYLKSADVFQDANLGDVGHGKTYVVNQERLVKL